MEISGREKTARERQEPRFMPALFWHYLKVALRKINSQRSYSFINIAGLSVADYTVSKHLQIVSLNRGKFQYWRIMALMTPLR